MLKRLRVKFICVITAIAAAMLVAVFGMVVWFTHADLEQQSIQLLRVAAGEPGQPSRPGQPGRPGPVSCFTLELLPEGSLLAVGSEQFDLSDEAYLRGLYQEAAATGEETGVLYRYSLRFLRAMSPRGEKYVFTDISAQRATMRNLVITCLLIGAAVLVVFFFIAMLLARWMVKPVEEAWARQRQFVADASHELKTPLTVITTNAELLHAPVGEERREQAAAGILTMSGQMRGLVEGLLELARVDGGAVPAHMGRVDFSRLVADGVLPFDAVFFEQGLTLALQAEEGIWLKGSESHLRQVLDILLDNARKYSFSGTEVRVSLRRQGRSQCLLSVSSVGEEISGEDLRNIFKRFYRVDKARTMNHSYGLGLAIAEGIVLDHRGKIWAESRDGVNTFLVQLPCE